MKIILGYVYIDSGAMYRAITLFFLRQNINLSNAAEVLEASVETVPDSSFDELPF